jgi:16S rRNA (cytidine1402-2'-O)-methyltransferase
MLERHLHQNESNKLYLVGTPIGNYDDMTYRAVDTLKNVALIYCEDTRITSQLLSHFDIHTPLRSYNVMTENSLTDSLIEEILSGKNVAVVSDAGMPGISDPGYLACKKAWEKGIDVVVVPGVSASLTALVGSSIPCRTFSFIGFLNSKPTQRKKELEELRYKQETMIIYEAPHRIKETLQMMDEIFQNRQIVLARELTKHYEEYLRGTAEEILTVVDELKGEMVIILSGATLDEINQSLNQGSIEEHYQFYIDQGFDKKAALKKVAEDRNLSKSDIYSKIFGKEKNRANQEK